MDTGTKHCPQARCRPVKHKVETMEGFNLPIGKTIEMLVVRATEEG